MTTRVGFAAGNVTHFWQLDKVGSPTPGLTLAHFSTVILGGPTHAVMPSGVARMRHGSTNGTVYFGAETAGTSFAPANANCTIPNDISGEYPMFVANILSDSAGMRGRHGVVIDMWYGSGGVATGDTYPADGTATFVQLSGMVLPWNGGPVNVS